MVETTALDKLAAELQAAFNLGDPAVVAALYEPDARWMGAAGGVFEGRGAIEEALARVMRDAPPQITFDERARVESGGYAVSRGVYRLRDPDDDTVVPVAGAYLNVLRLGPQGWRILRQQTTFGAEMRPEMWAGDRSVVAALPDGGTLVARLDFAARDVGVAGGPNAWTPDAQVALPGRDWVGGPALIRRSVRSRSDTSWEPEMARLVMHDVETFWLDGGLAVDTGWYEIGPAGPATQWGTYTLLARRSPQARWLVHWLAATSSPPGVAG